MTLLRMKVVTVRFWAATAIARSATTNERHDSWVQKLMKTGAARRKTRKRRRKEKRKADTESNTHGYTRHKTHRPSHRTSITKRSS